MQSLRCPSCSLVQWADQHTCKRCNAPLGSEAPRFAYTEPPPPYANAYSSHHSSSQLKTGLAITSMVLGIIAFPTTFLLIGLLLAPVAVVLGIVALRKASKQPNVYGGKGFAIAGIAVGSVVCVFFVPLIAAIAIPNLLASRRAANEGSALRTIEVIALAQERYSSENETGECGSLMELAGRKLINVEIADGRKSGYKFTAKGNASDDNGCEVAATPESSSHGTRSFYFSSSDGVLRFSKDSFGADHTDPPLSTDRASY